MPNNAFGLPYPLPTDPLTNGANDIKALADSLIGRIDSTISTDTFSVTAAPTSYPQGTSLMQLSSGGATAWPTGAFSAWVITIADAARGRVVQYIFRATLTYGWVRTGSGASWAAWRGATGPYASASGEVTATAVAAGTTKSVAVTLPGNLFSLAPQVSMTVRSTNALLRGAVFSGASPTGFTAYLGAQSAAGTVDVIASWIAVQDSSVASLLHIPDPQATYATVTCPTPGCGNEGIPIEVPITYTDDDTGLQVPIDAVQCGVCGSDLTP